MQERPYWWDTAPRREAAARDLPRRVDVAIVGGGYTGLAAARHLARTGASVVVFEREHAGWGASSRNAGQVLTGLRLDPATLVARYGEARARELFGIGHESIATLERLIADESIACEYRATGHLQAAFTPLHFRGFRDEQALLARVFGHEVAVLDRDDQASELGSRAYHGVLVDPRSAAINPLKYVRGLADAAEHAGAVIVEGTAVERIARRAGGWTLATAAGAVEAGDVLVATNGYTDMAAPWLQRRLVPIGSYIVVTKPIEPATAASLIPRGRMVFDTKYFLFYFRVLDDRRLLFGGRAEFSRPTAESARRAAAILRRGITHVFPQLRGVEVEYAWGGNVAFTRDEMPRAGVIGGAYYAGGYGGHGVAMATYLGTLIAERIAGQSMEHPLMDDRFAPIPLYYGNPWFLPAVGAYYRLKDLLA